MSLEISKNVYFDVVRRQLKYYDPTDQIVGSPELKDAPRYALIRKDTGKLLGIHSEDYRIRPYSDLAEKVNNVVEQTIDINKYKISTHDRVLEDGKKYRRDINFWDDAIDMQSYDKTTGMHIKGKRESIIPQIRIYSSMDGRWGQQIMWSSVYVVCMNGMVRPDWTFVVYNKHNKKQDISWGTESFKSGIVAHKELGEDLFKMMQKKVTNEDVSNLFKKTLASEYARNSLVDHTKANVMKDLSNGWERYAQKYGTTLFAVYQTATDWSSHPITKGALHNVSRKREKQVAEMMTSSEWLGLAA